MGCFGSCSFHKSLPYHIQLLQCILKYALSIPSLIIAFYDFLQFTNKRLNKNPGSCLLIHFGFPYSTVTDFVLMIHTASCPSYLCHAFQQTKHIPCPIIVFEHGVSTTSEGRSAGGSVDQLYMPLFFSLPEEQFIWDKGCFSSTHSSRMGAHAERTRANPQPPCGVMQKEMFLIIPTGILGSFNTIAEAENCN